MNKTLLQKRYLKIYFGNALCDYVFIVFLINPSYACCLNNFVWLIHYSGLGNNISTLILCIYVRCLLILLFFCVKRLSLHLCPSQIWGYWVLFSCEKVICDQLIIWQQEILVKPYTCWTNNYIKFDHIRFILVLSGTSV